MTVRGVSQNVIASSSEASVTAQEFGGEVVSVTINTYEAGKEPWYDSWQQPISWSDMRKYFDPVFGTNARKLIDDLESNVQSLEDHLDTAFIKSYGGVAQGVIKFLQGIQVSGPYGLGYISFVGSLGALIDYPNTMTITGVTTSGSNYLMFENEGIRIKSNKSGVDPYITFIDYPSVFGDSVTLTRKGTGSAARLELNQRMTITDGDTSYTEYGPNSTWGGYLRVGATPNVAGSNVAQVISTNGNLHLDAATGRDVYIGEYTTGRPIYLKGPTTTGYDFNGTKIYASDWVRPTGQSGLYFESYGGGLRMTDGTWIRIYGGKSFWGEAGTIGTDGGMTIGFGGGRSFGMDINSNMRTTGRYYSNEWIQHDNYSGLYSPLNAAHLQPNPGTFGSWSMSGDRNSWRGIEFGQGTWGMTLMMGATSLGVGNQINGVHANGYGWMWYNQWTNFYAGSYNGLSTITVKQDVKDLQDDALSIVLQLREVDFQYKDGTVQAMGNNAGTWTDRNIGFIAEEVNEICPEVVAMDPSGTKPTAISLMAMLPLLTKSIKQLTARLEVLENA
jgi:hypothetical protein